MYELALEYVPSSYVVVGNVGDAYYWIPGKREEAMEYYRRALEMAREALEDNPDNPGIHAMIGGYLAILDPDAAGESVERSLELAPEDAEVNYRACLAYEVLDQRTRALARLGKAIDLGFSTRIAENEPLLQELRQDSRYSLLVKKGGS
jgi:serine/threonine-protein kinase